MGALTVVVLIAFRRGFAGFLSMLYDRLAGKAENARVSLAPLDTGAIAALGKPAGLEL
jgi:hypothetical protein